MVEAAIAVHCKMELFVSSSDPRLSLKKYFLLNCFRIELEERARRETFKYAPRGFRTAGLLGVSLWQWNVNSLCMFWLCSVCFRKPRRKMLLSSTFQRKLGMFMRLPGKSKET